MFENPRSGRQARNFTTNVPTILDLKSSSQQIFSRKLPLGAPDSFLNCCIKYNFHHLNLWETSVICSADAFFFLKEIILFSHGKENAIWGLEDFVTLIFKIYCSHCSNDYHIK